MNHIEKLIQEHCPDGVPHIQVMDAFSVVPTARGIKRTEYTKGSTIAIVDQGQSLISGYTDKIELMIPEGPYTIFGDHTRAVKWVDFPFAVGADGVKVLKVSEQILPRFGYHALRGLHIPSRGYNRHWNVVNKLRIPLPPLPVQEAIVEILDTFSALEAELEAELEARKQQYEHYSRTLLAVTPDVAYISLGEAITNHDRKRKPVTRSNRQDGRYPYYGANGIQDFVHDFIFEGTFLLVGEDGSVKRSDGTPVLNWAEGQIWVNNHAHVLTASDDRFNLRYLFHFLKTVDISAFVTGGTQPKLNQKNMNRIEVPLLSREEQDRVVEILDKFDALVTDLSVGLPAELAARRKQYEYYRDKLLTFKELEVTA